MTIFCRRYMPWRPDTEAARANGGYSTRNLNEPELRGSSRKPFHRTFADHTIAATPGSRGSTRRAARIALCRRIGPFGFALIILIAGLLAAALWRILIGAALIWIPVVAVLVIIAAISGVLRRL